NALVRANASGYFDAIWDLDALTWPEQPLYGYTTNTNLSADHLHPTEACYRLMAPSLNTVVSYFFSQTGGATAVQANNFLNSIGICTHMGQGIDSPSQVATSLTYAGIREDREAGATSNM